VSPEKRSRGAPIDASKVVVTAFNLEDKLRKRKLEGL